jgi:hypothetical protein
LRVNARQALCVRLGQCLCQGGKGVVHYNFDSF